MKYVLGIDPGGTCGVVLYNREENLILTSGDVPPEFLFNMLEDASTEDVLIACEKPVRQPFRRHIDESVFRVAHIIEYICTKRGLHLEWVQPSEHKARFKHLKRSAYPVITTGHQMDALTVALHVSTK